MTDVLNSIAASPLLAALGAFMVLAVLLAPVALRLAGLSGGQIVETLRLTMQFFINLVQAFRSENASDKSSSNHK